MNKMSNLNSSAEREYIIMYHYTLEEIMQMVEEIRYSKGIFPEDSKVREIINELYTDDKSSFFIHLLALQQDLMFVMNTFVKTLQSTKICPN